MILTPQDVARDQGKSAQINFKEMINKLDNTR